MNTTQKTRLKLTPVPIAVDRLSDNYLLTKSIATHNTPTEIIGEMVRERIAAAV